jgi:hypothetical protein
MTPRPAGQPPAIPYIPPAQLQFHLDMAARMLRVTYRGQLELATNTLDLPLAFVKQVAGQIAAFEGQAEAQLPRTG